MSNAYTEFRGTVSIINQSGGKTENILELFKMINKRFKNNKCNFNINIKETVGGNDFPSYYINGSSKDTVNTLLNYLGVGNDIYLSAYRYSNKDKKETKMIKDSLFMMDKKIVSLYSEFFSKYEKIKKIELLFYIEELGETFDKIRSTLRIENKSVADLNTKCDGISEISSYPVHYETLENSVMFSYKDHPVYKMYENKKIKKNQIVMVPIIKGE